MPNRNQQDIIPHLGSARILVLITGTFALFLGLSGLIQYLVNPPGFLIEHPSFISIRFPAGILFVLSGLALISRGLGVFRFSSLAGAIVALISLLIVFENVLNQELGSQFLVPASFRVLWLEHPGRLAIPSSLSFLCIGLAVCIPSDVTRKKKLLLLGGLGAIVVGSGIVLILSNLSGIQFSSQNGPMSNLRYQVSGGIVVLGLGILAISRSQKIDSSLLPVWFSLIAAITIATGSYFLWRLQHLEEQRQINLEMHAQGVGIRDHLSQEIFTVADDFRKLYRLTPSGPGSREFSMKGEVLASTIPGCTSVVFLNASQSPIEIFSSKKQVDQREKFILSTALESELTEAIQTHLPQSTSPVTLSNGDKSVQVIIPVFKNSKWDGAFVVSLRSNDFLDAKLHPVALGYSLAISDGKSELYRRVNSTSPYEEKWHEDVEASVLGRIWKFSIWPNDQTFALHQPHISNWTLAVGLLVSAILGLIAYRIQTALNLSKDILRINRKLRNQILLREKAEKLLDDSREKFRVLVDQAADPILMVDRRGRFIEVNKNACDSLGYDRSELNGMKLFEVEESQVLMPILWNFKDNETIRVETKLRRKDRTSFYVEVHIGSVKINGETFFLALIRDIAARKEAEDSLRGFPKRIVEAQELERRRVANDLHDGVNQLLASVRMRIQTLEGRLFENNQPFLTEVVEVNRLLENALQEVRRISHNLRPSELDDLGLIPALRTVCEEFEKRTSISVIFNGHITQKLTAEKSLILYRIVQEALINVEKHSEASCVFLDLSASDQTLQIKIRDNGKGFSPSSLKGQKVGLGLISMRERAAFAGGDFAIKSALNTGTEIVVNIPLN